MYNCTIFSSLSKTYLYDGVSGNILSTDETNVDLINNSRPEEWQNQPEIKQAIKDGLIVPVESSELQYWFNEDDYFQTLFEEMSHLMINITDSCNMRCKYCIYGGHYPNEREHGCDFIDEDFAIRIIDRFIELSKSKNLIFNFYGGEPFLCYSAIQNAVAHINANTENSRIYITTNGTLINDNVCRWFSDNANVHLYVSIAGNPSTHDELRVFANGNPTFNIIYNNLKKLKEVAPDSYAERVHFVFNVFDERQLFEVQEFCREHEIFSGIKDIPEVTFIDCVDDDGEISKLCKEASKRYDKLASPLDKYIQLLSDGERDNVIVKYYDSKFLRIHNRSCGTEAFISGICRPFVKKMFVDLSGRLHLCENFTYGENFGSIFDEFSTDRVRDLLTSYKNHRCKSCVDCWANKLCSLCFRDVFDRDGTINSLRAEKICSMEKQILQKTLGEYCYVLETSSSLLDHLNEYEVYV